MGDFAGVVLADSVSGAYFVADCLAFVDSVSHCRERVLYSMATILDYMKVLCIGAFLGGFLGAGLIESQYNKTLKFASPPYWRSFLASALAVLVSSITFLLYAFITMLSFKYMCLSLILLTGGPIVLITCITFGGLVIGTLMKRPDGHSLGAGIGVGIFLYLLLSLTITMFLCVLVYRLVKLVF